MIMYQIAAEQIKTSRTLRTPGEKYEEVIVIGLIHHIVKKFLF
jgi:hypothetical protein